MSEKRFTYGETIDYNFFDVFEEKKYLGMIQRDSTKIVDVLNTQQATIQELERKLKKYAKIGEDQLKQIIELQEENEQLKETIEKLRWDLDKTREDLNYFANLKITAMKGYEPMEDDGDGV